MTEDKPTSRHLVIGVTACCSINTHRAPTHILFYPLLYSHLSQRPSGFMLQQESTPPDTLASPRTGRRDSAIQLTSAWTYLAAVSSLC